jgi:NAD(P)-dependent dehydrogenase (short-subunit alcohol dehydrogenase family)
MNASALEGQVAMVTGSSRGLGRHLALALAGHGADVIINYHREHLAAEEVVDLAQKQGVRAMALQADVRDWSQMQRLAAAALKRMGRLDILVNNVGDFLQKSLLEMDVIEWQEMIASNLHSAFFGCRAVLPAMRHQGYGRIINIGLANANRIHAYATVAAYAIAKTGVQILTRSLAQETALYGITVNMVSPGLMESDLTSMEEKRQQINAVPMRRLGVASDLVGAVLYLLSEQAEYVTGADITVSGGWGL